ncbi:hypothetical protein [Bremerella sp.]|uniref:hypothetical protein n=1 Tax=Bremerella sp. TaxID=2795602 RepID=UPI00391D20AD
MSYRFLTKLTYASEEHDLRELAEYLPDFATSAFKNLKNSIYDYSLGVNKLAEKAPGIREESISSEILRLIS